MTVTIQNFDIKQVDDRLLEQLRECSYGSTGWMIDIIANIRNGYWHHRYSYKKLPLNYNRGRALIIFDDMGNVMAWALVRLPRRSFRTSWTRRSWSPSLPSVRQRARGGARPDFMVYVHEPYRKKRLARSLLIAAYSVYGKVDVYPHDVRSKRFFDKNKHFCVPKHTDNFTSAHYISREVG